MGKDDRAVIDTNVLVRYLTEDDPEKAEAVDVLLHKAANGEVKILVPSVVIAELVWVLESFYRLKPEEISELAGAILDTPGIDIQDRSILREALRIYVSKGIDFIDAWIIEFAASKGIKKIYTFDKKHFRNIEAELAVP